MKRALRLHKAIKSRFIYLLSGQGPSIETIRVRLKVAQTEPFRRYLQEWQIKLSEAQLEVGTLDVYLQEALWSQAGCRDRHVYTRYIVHGYHHLVCSFKSYHQPGDGCLCRFCMQLCDKYHASSCSVSNRSLHCLCKPGGNTI